MGLEHIQLGEAGEAALEGPVCLDERSGSEELDGGLAAKDDDVLVDRSEDKVVPLLQQLTHRRRDAVLLHPPLGGGEDVRRVEVGAEVPLDGGTAQAAVLFAILTHSKEVLEAPDLPLALLLDVSEHLLVLTPQLVAPRGVSGDRVDLGKEAPLEVRAALGVVGAAVPVDPEDDALDAADSLPSALLVAAEGDLDAEGAALCRATDIWAVVAPAVDAINKEMVANGGDDHGSCRVWRRWGVVGSHAGKAKKDETMLIGQRKPHRTLDWKRNETKSERI